MTKLQINAFSRSRLILYLRDGGQEKLLADDLRIISIRDSNCPNPILQNRKNVLNLSFDDIEPVMPENEEAYRIQGQTLFSDWHKTLIEAFLMGIDPDSLSHLIVNCHAGVSRSGAVAAYAGLHFFGNFEKVLNENVGINPNRWVLQKLGILDEWDRSQKVTDTEETVKLSWLGELAKNIFGSQNTMAETSVNN